MRKLNPFKGDCSKFLFLECFFFYFCLVHMTTYCNMSEIISPDISRRNEVCMETYPLAISSYLYSWIWSQVEETVNTVIPLFDSTKDVQSMEHESTTTTVDTKYLFQGRAGCIGKRKSMPTTSQCKACLETVYQRMLQQCPNYYIVGWVVADCFVSFRVTVIDLDNACPISP